MWKWKENWIVQATLKKESKSGGCTQLDFHSYYKATLKKKEDMCIRIADSLYYAAEMNTMLKSNYIKKNNYKIKIK